MDAAVIAEIEQLSFEGRKPKKPKDNSKALKNIDKQIERLVDLYSVDGISIDDLRTRIDALKRRKEALMTVEEPVKQIPPKDVVMKAIHSDDFQQKKLIVDALIDRIEIDGEDVHIYWNF